MVDTDAVWMQACAERMDVRDAGTPLGGDRDLQRLRDVRQRLMSPAAIHIGTPETPPRASPVTMEAIEMALSNQLQPLKSQISKLSLQMSDLNMSVDERFTKIETETAEQFEALKTELDTNIEAIDERVKMLEAKTATQNQDGDLASKVERLEREVQQLLAARGETKTAIQNMATTAVVGGLRGMGSKADAVKWVEDQLWRGYCARPIEIYTKGDFKGLLFCKFENSTDRDDAVKYFKVNGLKSGADTVWAKPDLPISERAPQSLLFGAKFLLSTWGVPKSSVWVDLGDHSLWFDGVVAFKTLIDNQTLKVIYEPEWEEYMRCDEWSELVSSKAKMIEQGGAHKGKGKGKTKT